MSNPGVCLASMDGLGQIYDCGSCGNIHVQVGPVNLTMEPKAYMQFVTMISTSAANFEVWMQHKSGVDFSDIRRSIESVPDTTQEETNWGDTGK